MGDTLLFDRFFWVVFMMPFVGLLAAGLSKRKDPTVRGRRILRHDGPARAAHWSHAIGTVLLLVSGIVLGTRFTPSFTVGKDAVALWFNVHFLFVLLFLFGTFYWLGNTVVSRWRFREHLPTKHALSYTLNHYGSLLGFKSCTYPKEAKYFESERMAFILALVATAAVLISGLLKVLAHVLSLPEGFLNVVTWTHDCSAALMLLFLAAHVFFGAVLPFSWPNLRSMFTGYVALEHAEREHPAWVESIKEVRPRPSEPNRALHGNPQQGDVTDAEKGIEHA
ncbi:MAG: cytochrome b/b6 domain-containing protein [Gordonibacter pamelaeae]|uniref:cytochrome b/b6 domain-containing protein n=1 Tax=Gordonibacter pamelaeae TaxID=471189 RepID=UPI002FE00637